MKKLLIAPLLMIAMTNYAQTGIIAGITAGYASNNYLVGSMGVGAKMGRINTTVNITAFAVNKRDVPTVFDFRVGYKISDWEVFAGPAYHYAGEPIVKDEKDPNTGYAAYNTEIYSTNTANGMRLTFGLIKHFGVFNVGFYQLGKISSIQIGLRSK